MSEMDPWRTPTESTDAESEQAGAAVRAPKPRTKNGKIEHHRVLVESLIFETISRSYVNYKGLNNQRPSTVWFPLPYVSISPYTLALNSEVLTSTIERTY